MLRNNANARRCSYFELGPPVVQREIDRHVSSNTFGGNFGRLDHSENREHMKIFRNVDCVLANHKKWGGD